MVSADGRLVLVYNGCVYNFAELRAELEGAGRRFRSCSDTEVILEAMAAWGIERAVKRFVGMFAFAVWDTASRRLSLCRDRLGIKPLHYGFVGGSFVFASELRAFEAHPDFVAAIDRDALALYVTRGCVPAPRTIYRGIYKLPPGTILTFDANQSEPSEPQPYWTLRDAAECGVNSPYRGSAEDASRELEELLQEAIRCRLVADVPLGVLLSGGIDSSLIASLVAATAARTKTFTVGFFDQRYDEAEDAKKIARYLGTEHHEVHVTANDFRALIPQLPQIYDEPFADSSQIPTYMVAQLARSAVKVTLTGDGGDEMFGGYARYLWTNIIGKSARALPMWLRRFVAHGLTRVSTAEWDRLIAHLPISERVRTPGRRLHKLAAVLDPLDPPHLYGHLVSHWPQNRKVVLDGNEPPTVVTEPTLWPHVDNFIDQMMYLDAMTYLPDDILTKIDRATMAVGIEARMPFLDHRLVEFAWRLPTQMKIAGGKGKLPLRRILYRHVPRALVDRPKAGFAIPLAEWLREPPLRDWVESLLQRDRLEGEGFFDTHIVRTIWDDHISSRHDRHYELWDILMFQAWLDNKQRSRPMGVH